MPDIFGNALPWEVGSENTGLNNPFSLQDLEGTDRGERAIFEQAIPDFLRTDRQSALFSSMFDQIKNEFARQIGQDFAAGVAPRESFTEFVEGQDLDRRIRRRGFGGGSGVGARGRSPRPTPCAWLSPK